MPFRIKMFWCCFYHYDLRNSVKQLTRLDIGTIIQTVHIKSFWKSRGFVCKCLFPYLDAMPHDGSKPSYIVEIMWFKSSNESGCNQSLLRAIQNSNEG